MMVWVLVLVTGWEDSELVGVFSSEAAAKAAAVSRTVAEFGRSEIRWEAAGFNSRQQLGGFGPDERGYRCNWWEVEIAKLDAVR